MKNCQISKAQTTPNNKFTQFNNLKIADAKAIKGGEKDATEFIVIHDQVGG